MNNNDNTNNNMNNDNNCNDSTNNMYICIIHIHIYNTGGVDRESGRVLDQ